MSRAGRGLRPVTRALCLVAALMLQVQGAHAAPSNMPSFQLVRINGDGGTLSDKDLRGTVVLLNVWASWCPGCKDEMPELMALQDGFGQRGFSVVAVNIDNRLDNALDFMEKFSARAGRPLNFPVLYDGGKIIARTLRPQLLPTSYLIDAQGRIVDTFAGSITGSRLDSVREAIRAVKEAP